MEPAGELAWVDPLVRMTHSMLAMSTRSIISCKGYLKRSREKGLGGETVGPRNVTEWETFRNGETEFEPKTSIAGETSFKSIGVREAFISVDGKAKEGR